MLKLDSWSLEPYGTFCHMLTCPQTRQALLIDPAGEAERLLSLCKKVEVRRIILTHGHGDHRMALDEVKAALGAPVGIHLADAERFELAADFDLRDGMRMGVGRYRVRLVHIPGHTPGSMAVRFDQRAVVGDAIFPGGPGATRDPAALVESLISLQRTVFTWPDETQLHPGHGSSTTVGAERPAFQAFLARPRPADLCGDVTWQAEG